VVVLHEQKVYAYENGQVVHSSLASTGTARSPTPVGRYHIYSKYISTLMRGPGYYLPNVPYTMYYYGSYGLHGTYWHKNFGHPMSHGCVNLPTAEAKWFYEWAPVGTLVTVKQ
jgi:lipoprotein-anchoring transpeptidase ErfK/SrfK